MDAILIHLQSPLNFAQEGDHADSFLFGGQNGRQDVMLCGPSIASDRTRVEAALKFHCRHLVPGRPAWYPLTMAARCAKLTVTSNGVEPMPSPEYSLPDVLERMYQNQLALEAALMELTLLAERQGHDEAGDNIRTALNAIGENAGHISQGLARLKAKDAM